MKIIESAEDVTSDVLADAKDVWEGWFAGGRINWEAFIDRLSDSYGSVADDPYELLDLDSPAIRKIQRHIQALRALPT